MTLALRLAEALAAPPPDGLRAGDSTEWPDEPSPAAVLIAVTRRERPGLILTERRHDLRQHPGQVAFPGGRIDPGETPVAAALREAWEEIALEPAAAHVIGMADPWRTGTGFAITPVVALVDPDLPLAPNPAEVARWFEAPLDHVLDPANQREQTVFWRGKDRTFLEIDWEGHRIWGATAGMIANLSRRLS